MKNQTNLSKIAKAPTLCSYQVLSSSDLKKPSGEGRGRGEGDGASSQVCLRKKAQSKLGKDNFRKLQYSIKSNVSGQNLRYLKSNMFLYVMEAKVIGTHTTKSLLC